jgi:microcin C transport system permease protein
MFAYIIRRLLLIPPTLIGIMLINFVIIQAAPGGPVEQMIAEITGTGPSITQRVTRSDSGETIQQSGGGGAESTGASSRYRGAQGLDPKFIEELERQYGFDKPAHERFLKMMASYITFDFGDSFFQDRSVVDLVLDKMPVSISLGIWTTLIVYLISIPLGIAKAAVLISGPVASSLSEMLFLVFCSPCCCWFSSRGAVILTGFPCVG